MKILISVLFLFFSVTISFSQVTYVTTLHPFKEILNAIVGARGEVKSILPPGASPHTFQLKPSDMRKVESATALIIGGRNLDDWALKFQNSVKLELINLIPDHELMPFELNEAHKKEHVEHQHHHHDGGIDPHFWTDPLVVKSLIPPLVDKLCKIDPKGGETYQLNAKRFALELDNLYTKIQKELSLIHGKKVMLSHPFFRYFFKRFNITLIGITETSPGKEPTPKELNQMIQTIKKEDVKAIFSHVQLPDRAAKLIGEAAAIQVFELDPIGGVVGRHTYEEILLYNTKIILSALQ